MIYDVERAKTALNILTASTYYAQTWRKIVAASKKPRAAPFADDQETLNELVLIGRQSPDALDKLYTAIKMRRLDKNDYQREFMAAKRRRDNKAVKLEEAVTGKRLSLKERIAFLQAKYIEWHAHRDSLLSEAGDVEWEERNAIIRGFWDKEEARIDQALQDFC